MIARLWWKEARQVGPIWAFLAGLGLFWVGMVRWYVGAELKPGALGAQSLLVTLVYLFLIGAAVFAGERENRTLGLLDALPVARWRVWTAKASFAAASTAALGLVLWLFVLSLEGLPRNASPGGVALVGFLLLAGLGWSLFWSALSGNALLAAALAIVSLTLTALQLNSNAPLTSGGPSSESLTVWHWLFAVALVAASALILHLGGPPRAWWLGTRRRPRRAPVETTDKNISFQPLVAGRTGLASRLAWQALREVWPVWWPLAVIGVGLPLAWAVTNSSNDPAFWLLGSLAVSLVAGANVFNAENRRGTQRFLAHHGARPGLVWLVKLAVGLATVAPIWLVAAWLTPTLWGPAGLRAPMPGALGAPVSFQFAAAVALVGGYLVGAFAAGAWCGMVFRRGITAGLVSLILWIVVCLPPLLLVSLGLVWPMHLPWIPIAILAVTWAWSGDWLLDRPGFGRWARLGAYSAAALAIVFSAYVAERVWSVPTIPEAERERIFQFDRIAAPVAPERNAAGLYREVGVNQLGHALIGDKILDFQDVVYGDWDTSSPEVLDWLNRNEANLEMLRKAAAMPVCRFQDLRKATLFSMSGVDEGLGQFVPALAVSARVRLAGGNLKAAWADIEALLRMGRQFSELNPDQARIWGGLADRWGLSLAMWWAADSRQTAESLESARDAYRSLPPSPSEADQLRAEALVVRNTIEMPREDLVRELLARESKDASWMLVKLSIDAMTTPWEMARFRRAQDLMAAARIRLEGGVLDHVGRFPKLDEFLVGFKRATDRTSHPIFDMRLWKLELTTPLARRLGVDGAIARVWDSNAAPRRAFDAILALRLWQARHDGKLPRSLDELEAADPEVGPSLTDPYASPPARFGYVASAGQSLLPLGQFNPMPDTPVARTFLLKPTQGFMLLYSVGPDKKDDRAWFNLNDQNKGDIVFPLKDDVPPPK